MTFIRDALCKLSPIKFHAEFIIHALELLHAPGPHLQFPPPPSPESPAQKNTTRKKKCKRCEKPLMPASSIAEITATSNNGAMILASLSALISLFSVLGNTRCIQSHFTALDAALRYLPLTQDKPLLATASYYLFMHLSHDPRFQSFFYEF
ncbi:rsc complex subunit rsc9 [Ceratobasidium sp. AG-Ba]|nr:rsc complex subunit rsc9 [Ceratobasidium sp. AG-Ba]